METQSPNIKEVLEAEITYVETDIFNITRDIVKLQYRLNILCDLKSWLHDNEDRLMDAGTIHVEHEIIRLKGDLKAKQWRFDLLQDARRDLTICKNNLLRI